YEKVPGIYFFDSLPYPGCNLNKVFQSLLIDPKLIELKKTKTLNQKKERKKILLYADDLFPEWLGSALSKLANGRFSISAAGSSRIIPQFPEIENLGRMDRQSFYNVLLESDIVFSYFGMLYFESLYLHKTAVLYTRGTERSEHGILSEYFSCEMGVPYLKSIQDFLDFDFNIQPQSPKIKISGYGYKALQDLILMIRKDTVRS
ncbi:MAG: hypothetical protein OEZ34_15685, partial [Spirochaetia bacterium]|nr:hypothetical protein [Spirochaetia bacterium]